VTSSLAPDPLLLAVLDGCETGILVLGPDGRVRLWNSWLERMADVSRAAALGKTLEELFPEIADSRVASAARDAVERGMSALISRGLGRSWLPLRGCAPQHDRFDAVQQVIVIKPIDLGGERGCLMHVSDVTDSVLREHMLTRQAETGRRLTEELERRAHQLAQSNRELSRFAYVASHDLQEPLRKITTFGERLASTCGDQLPGRGSFYLERMRDAASRMQGLIRALLAFSRVIADSPVELVDLRALVGQIVEDLDVRVQLASARIEIGALPRLEGNPDQLAQLFLNLISNALRFQRPDESVEVRIDSEIIDADTCVIRVSDDGIGIEKQYHERVFEIFQRLHGREAYEGTGIGLAICRKVAERHSGSIRVESEPGEGSTFAVTLPLRQPD